MQVVMYGNIWISIQFASIHQYKVVATDWQVTPCRNPHESGAFSAVATKY